VRFLGATANAACPPPICLSSGTAADAEPSNTPVDPHCMLGLANGVFQRGGAPPPSNPPGRGRSKLIDLRVDLVGVSISGCEKLTDLRLRGSESPGGSAEGDSGMGLPRGWRAWGCSPSEA